MISNNIQIVDNKDYIQTSKKLVEYNPFNKYEERSLFEGEFKRLIRENLAEYLNSSDTEKENEEGHEETILNKALQRCNEAEKKINELVKKAKKVVRQSKKDTKPLKEKVVTKEEASKKETPQKNEQIEQNKKVEDNKSTQVNNPKTSSTNKLESSKRGILKSNISKITMLFGFIFTGVGLYIASKPLIIVGTVVIFSVLILKCIAAMKNMKSIRSN